MNGVGVLGIPVCANLCLPRCLVANRRRKPRALNCREFFYPAPVRSRSLKVLQVLLGDIGRGSDDCRRDEEAGKFHLRRVGKMRFWGFW